MKASTKAIRFLESLSISEGPKADQAVKLADLQPYDIGNMMDRKGGSASANRLLKELSELYDYAPKKLVMNFPNPTGAVDKRKVREGGFGKEVTMHADK